MPFKCVACNTKIVMETRKNRRWTIPEIEMCISFKCVACNTTIVMETRKTRDIIKTLINVT